MTAGSEMTTDEKDKDIDAGCVKLYPFWRHYTEAEKADRRMWLRKAIAAIDDSALRRSRTGQWRTIDSAPKDGRPILLAYSDGNVVEGHYLDNSRENPPWAGFRPYFSCIEKVGVKFTHWQPLPPAPTDSTPAHAPGVTEVDDDMVERALRSWFPPDHFEAMVDDQMRSDMRAALRAALSRPADSKENADDA